ncbi:MAG: 2-oxoacid:acceptor oxidoreductase subunit alpha [Methanospirillum sp.]
MQEFSVLIGGRAGEGINKASAILNHVMAKLGRYVYMYYDYPSLIRGGHNFAIVRSADHPVRTHRDRVDVILALDQKTVDQHAAQLAPGGVIVFDTYAVKNADGVGVDLDRIVKEEKAPAITRNSGLVGAFCRVAGIPWEVVEEVFREEVPPAFIDVNLRVVRRAWDGAEERLRIERGAMTPLPVLTGNEAVALGLVKGGLDAYIAYPMTPTSNILHFLAEFAEHSALTVVHPESEISVILMALGAAYAGKRCAVGTSGGGFCLMTESVSLAGQAELPVAIVLGQRPGPSTGLPTYSCQTELLFARHAGQGEFPRLIVAPGDADEAYVWAARVLDLAWRFQLPGFLLVDKTLCEGGYSCAFDPAAALVPPSEAPGDVPLDPYLRYRVTESGVSPMLPAGTPGAVVKVNSYEHDEAGITIEDGATTVAMQEKRMRKGAALAAALEAFETVAVYGGEGARVGVVSWGSTVGAVREAAADLPVRVVQPVVLEPFPVEAFRKAVDGLDRIVVVEENMTGQLEQLMRLAGFPAGARVHRYDGRPFTVEEMAARLAEVI